LHETNTLCGQNAELLIATADGMYLSLDFFFFAASICAITASGVPDGTLVSMNRFNTLCG
jgi:hypothetical protein